MPEAITTKKIKAQFNVTPSQTSTSSKRTWSFTYVVTGDDEPALEDIQAFATAMITNNSIFDTPPLSIVKVEIEETTTEQVLPSE